MKQNTGSRKNDPCVFAQTTEIANASHQRIRPESVLDMTTVISPPAPIRAFTDIAKPMFDRINRNTEQSRTLATLRDTLLPKLLSGELSVGDTTLTTGANL